MTFRRADVEAYLQRPWGLLEEDAARVRATAYLRDPAWSWRTADALREQVARENPDWPTDADRAADFAHHVELCALLDRTSDALARRRRVS